MRPSRGPSRLQPRGKLRVLDPLYLCSAAPSRPHSASISRKNTHGAPLHAADVMSSFVCSDPASRSPPSGSREGCGPASRSDRSERGGVSPSLYPAHPLEHAAEKAITPPTNKIFPIAVHHAVLFYACPVIVQRLVRASARVRMTINPLSGQIAHTRVCDFFVSHTAGLGRRAGPQSACRWRAQGCPDRACSSRPTEPLRAPDRSSAPRRRPYREPPAESGKPPRRISRGSSPRARSRVGFWKPEARPRTTRHSHRVLRLRVPSWLRWAASVFAQRPPLRLHARPRLGRGTLIASPSAGGYVERSGSGTSTAPPWCEPRRGFDSDTLPPFRTGSSTRRGSTAAWCSNRRNIALYSPPHT